MKKWCDVFGENTRAFCSEDWARDFCAAYGGTHRSLSDARRRENLGCLSFDLLGLSWPFLDRIDCGLVCLIEADYSRCHALQRRAR